MRKKLFRIATIPYSIGGLLTGQLKHMTSDYEVVAVASTEPEGFLEKAAAEQNARAIGIPMTRKITPFKDLRSLVKLYRILKREKPFFVHTHTPKAGLIGMMAAYFAGVPHRLHDIAGLPLLEATGFKRFVLNWVEKVTYACATQVYPNSRGMHRIVLENRFARPDKFRVLDKISSNGVNTERFNRNNFKEEELKALKQSLDISESDFVGIFVGRLVTDKGINELVAAFVALSEKYDDLKLLLVGMHERDLDPLLAQTENYIDTHPAIIAVGPKPDVRPYFSIADALVFPSYREGFPNAVMESGAMGIASIVSDINGCNEIIEEGVNGLIVPPKDTEALINAIEKLYLDRGLLHELASRSRKMIKDRYEQKDVWAEILKEYRRLEGVSASG